MMTPLLEACPSFQPTWDAFVQEWRDDASGLPIYVVLTDLARHLVRMLERGETTSFPSIFRVIEEWHRQGDPYVKEAATVGLLEDLQNTNLHTATSPEQFRPYLGPLSTEGWNDLRTFWEGGGGSDANGNRERSGR